MTAGKETDAINTDFAELTDDALDAVNGGGEALPLNPPKSDSNDIVLNGPQSGSGDIVLNGSQSNSGNIVLNK